MQRGELSMKKCTNCQALINDSANFCHLCGGSDFAPAEAEPVTPQNVAAEPVQPEPAESAPQEPVVEQPASQEPIVEESTPQTPVQEPPVTEMPPINKNWYQDGPIVPPAPKKKLNKGLVIGICAAVAVVIAAIVVTLVLTNPVRRFMKSIEANDPDTAFSIYIQDIADNEKRVEKLDATIDDYVDKQMELYIAEEITYDELNSRLTAIANTYISNDKVYDALNESAMLYHYRETYAAAEEAFQNGEYDTAVLLYTEVAGQDFEHGEEATDKLAQATESFRNQTLTDVDSSIASHEYSTAKMLLEEALWILPGDAKLLSAQEACLQAEYDYTIDCLIDEALVFTNHNDYVSAIQFLDEQLGVYPGEVRLQQAKDDCLVDFEKYVIEESFRVASEGNFTHAVSLTSSGLSYFTSAPVSELHTIYLSHIPVNLGDMEIFKNDTKGGSWATYTNKTDKYLEDKFGSTYSHSLSAGCGSLIYHLNFKYQSFSGTVAFPKGLESSSARESATLTIYGDDQEIAVFRDVTDASKPQEFNLDVSSYEQITLKWTCEGYNIWEDWGDFATIFDGVLTPIPMDLPDSVN